MKLDILAFGVHPDDVELGCSGTLLRHMAQGRSAGIVDLTKGELGTRGSALLRAEEAAAAAKILGITVRENLGMADGFFAIDETNLRLVIAVLRKYRPQIVFCNAVRDRHPDHGRASQLVSEACFLAGLRKISTLDEAGQEQEAWRPAAVYHYIQDEWVEPQVVVDITDFVDQKMKSVLAYGSQFYNPDNKSDEPQTAISGPGFLEHVMGRAVQTGRYIQARYAEGFTTEKPVGADDLFLLR